MGYLCSSSQITASRSQSLICIVSKKRNKSNNLALRFKYYLSPAMDVNALYPRKHEQFVHNSFALLPNNMGKNRFHPIQPCSMLSFVIFFTILSLTIQPLTLPCVSSRPISKNDSIQPLSTAVYRGTNRQYYLVPKSRSPASPNPGTI